MLELNKSSKYYHQALTLKELKDKGGKGFNLELYNKAIKNLRKKVTRLSSLFSYYFAIYIDECFKLSTFKASAESDFYSIEYLRNIKLTCNEKSFTDKYYDKLFRTPNLKYSNGYLVR